ncbi:MAG: hypothetical protein U0263_22230 [Polyangiaceae bacterium]
MAAERRRAAGRQLGRLAVHDLDDDGVPEVIREATVLDGKTGATKGASPAEYATHSQGLDPVLADLDQDPAIGITNGALVWQWTASGWQQEGYFSAAAPGFPAVADFGAFGASLPANNPELAVVRKGSATIYAGMDGTTVLGPISVPGGGGGPPTVADYDGDGLPELEVAGEAFAGHLRHRLQRYSPSTAPATTPTVATT